MIDNDRIEMLRWSDACGVVLTRIDENRELAKDGDVQATIVYHALHKQLKQMLADMPTAYMLARKATK